MGEFSRVESSEFSMDFSLFYRVDTLFQKLNLATLTLDLYLWYNLILVLYKEIAPLIKKAEREKYSSNMSKLLPRFIELKSIAEKTGWGYLVIPLLFSAQYLSLSKARLQFLR